MIDLAGYRIYWGQGSGSYPNSTMINNPVISSHVIGGLVPGTYEFVSTELSLVCVESAFSIPATTTVD